MAYRNVYIENPAKLSVSRSQLVIEQDEKYSLPIEDLQAVMIETKRCTLTVSVLSALADAQVALFTCDERHLPCSITLPLANHSRKLSILGMQLELSKRTKDRVWQKIVRQKITNQSSCLKFSGNGAYRQLEHMISCVVEGDRTYQESQAARFYFPELYGIGFSRGNDNTYNAALNYGYAIVRGVICRELCAYGFEPALGIFHHSELNPFNLADDLIEPFRQFVDLWVFENVYDVDLMLTPKMKRSLFGLLMTNCLIDEEVHTLSYAIRLTVRSLSTCYKNNSAVGLVLPQLIPLVEHKYE